MADFRKISATFVIAFCLATGAGCTNAQPEDDDETIVLKDDEEWAPCSEVFVEGASVSAKALGCVNSLGERERYGRIDCEDGSTILAMTDDLWAKDGIVVSGNEDAFSDDIDVCKGRQSP